MADSPSGRGAVGARSKCPSTAMGTISVQRRQGLSGCIGRAPPTDSLSGLLAVMRGHKHWKQDTRAQSSACDRRACTGEHAELLGGRLEVTHFV